jgi:hypothetical protein
MSRTRRMVVIPEKSHHRNAKPYKRTSHILFQKDFGDVEVTIEKDDRIGHSY